MGNKFFRNSLFGYNRLDVTMYFEKVSLEFKTELEKKEAELENIKSKLKNNEEELEMLRRMKEEFETEKENISRAIIQAEGNAQAIIEEAKKAAVQEKIEIQNDILKETATLRHLKQETANLRRSVIALINRFNVDLEQHS